MSEWQEVKLGTLVESVSETFKFTDKPVVFLNTSDILADKFLHSDLSEPKTLPGQAKKRIKKGDLLFSEIRPANKRYALVNFNADDYVVSTKLMVLRSKGNIDPTYLKLFLTSAETLDYLQMIAEDRSGTFPQITFDILNQMDLMVPPLLEQKAIASVLSSLGDKIDLLHRQNTTLERMAETLFRQWFVEEAQEDWQEVTISSLCTLITKGTTPTTLGHAFVESGVNFIKAESITDAGGFISEKFAKISAETHLFLKRSIIQKSDVLCSIAGTIGRVAIIEDSILPANTNQAIAILRVDESKCFPEFIYLFLKSDYFQEVMDGKIVHAVQPNLSLGEIGSTTFKIAPFEKLLEFKALVKGIFDKKTNNLLQIQTLEKLRDNLLPKLMSGEVRVL